MFFNDVYLVKERIAFLKLTDTYDIFDPADGSQIAIAKEKSSGVMKYLRLVLNKGLLPSKVFVYEGDDFNNESKLQFSIQRGFSFLRSRVNVCDASGNILGYMISKIFTLGGAFTVFDNNDKQVAYVKGDWKGWNFEMTDSSGNTLGKITKKWTGLGQELFTSADNYIIKVFDNTKKGHAILLLAAGLAVDTVYKEKS